MIFEQEHRISVSKLSVIAIDGAAAAGKSTAGALLAEALNYLYFDTGVMYRAVTCVAIDRGVNPDDEAAVSEVAEALLIEIKPTPPDHSGITDPSMVVADGVDITACLRTPAVDAAVSRVSSYARVRYALTAQQRRIAAEGQVVMIGRDIGTVVVPDAMLKVFMVASAEERANRRFRQATSQGYKVDPQQILQSIKERDQKDREKPISPMVPADDAIVMDTSRLSIQAVVSQLKLLAEERLAGR